MNAREHWRGITTFTAVISVVVLFLVIGLCVQQAFAVNEEDSQPATLIEADDTAADLQDGEGGELAVEEDTDTRDLQDGEGGELAVEEDTNTRDLQDGEGDESPAESDADARGPQDGEGSKSAVESDADAHNLKDGEDGESLRTQSEGGQDTLKEFAISLEPDDSHSSSFVAGASGVYEIGALLSSDTEDWDEGDVPMHLLLTLTDETDDRIEVKDLGLGGKGYYEWLEGESIEDYRPICLCLEEGHEYTFRFENPCDWGNAAGYVRLSLCDQDSDSVFTVEDGVLISINKPIVNPHIPEGVKRVKNGSACFGYGYYGREALIDTITFPTSFGADDSLPDSSAFQPWSTGAGSVDALAYHVLDGNEAYKSIDGVIYSADGTMLVCVPDRYEGTLDIVEGTKTILPYAVMSDRVETVVLPESLESIESSAFLFCEKLTRIEINSNVELETLVHPSLGVRNISEFVLGPKATQFRVEDQCLIRSGYTYAPDESVKGDVLVLVSADFDGPVFQIPDSVVALSENAFPDRSEITHLIIGKKCCDLGLAHLQYIANIEVSQGNKAFSLEGNVLYCDGRWGKELTKFLYGYGVTKFVVPADVYRIGYAAFYNATGEPRDLLQLSFAGEDTGLTSNAVFMTEPDHDFEEAKLTVYGIEGSQIYDDFHEYADSDDRENVVWGGSVIDGDTSDVFGNFTTTYDDKPRSFEGLKGFRYKDSYFYEPATKYNHSLATMSLCMAFSAYGCKPYKTYDSNIKELMSKCGFADDGRYKQYHFNEVPEQDFIACAIGSKSILVEGESVTLIAVAVRGGGYEDEWASNFDVGSSGDHAGFDLNAERVKDYVIDYIGEKNIAGDVKIWITGFSRAGAVATQAAAKLNDLSGFAYEDDSSDSGYTRVDFDKSTIYAYGFATPAGACRSSNPHSDDYSNIWNVIEYNDPVPLLAPQGWDFDRYGTTKLLPYHESNDAETYKAYFDRMRDRLDEGYGYNIEDFTNYTADLPVNFYSSVLYAEPNYVNLDTQGTALRKAVRALVEVMGGREKYAHEYQLEVEAIAERLLGGDTSDLDLGNYAIKIIYDFACQKIPQFTLLHPNLSATVLYNIPTLGEVHQDQDYYLGWMQLMDENYEDSLPVVWGDPSFRIFKANCPIDLYVYDANGETVASIVGEEPSADEDQSVIVSIDENGQKIAYLPNGVEYRIGIVARKACDVSCGIEEVSAERGDPVRVTNFETTSLASGASMEAEIPAIPEGEMIDAESEGSGVSYAMRKDAVDIEVVSDMRGMQAIAERTFNVTVSFDETEGQVYGGGSFVEGSYSHLEAVSNEAYLFDGYYIDGVKLENADGEDANTARIKVTKDLDVEARFRQKQAISVPSAAVGLVYTGKEQRGVAAGKGYSVEGGTATKAGKYTATVTPKTGYMWVDGTSTAKKVTFTIAKAANTLTVKSAKSTQVVKKGKKAVLKAKNVFKVTKNTSKGKLAYKLVGVNKKNYKKFFKVTSGGKLTVKKGLKKGKYALKIKVTTKATANYKAATKYVTVKVRVK